MKTLTVGAVDAQKVSRAVELLKTHTQKDVAAQLHCCAATVRRWAKLAPKIKEYRVELVGKGVSTMEMALVTSVDGPLSAAVAALRNFPAIKALTLPDWEVHVDGKAFKLIDVRKGMSR